MRHRRPSSLVPASAAKPLSVPDKGLFRQAWGLFVFSAFFAVGFNAFYVDGIELKHKTKKDINWRPSPQPALPGFGMASQSSAPDAATPTPLPGESNPFPRLSLMGVKERFDKKTCVFLDARKPEEYGEGHIPGALNFYANEIGKFAPVVLPQLQDKAEEIVAYCHGGDCDFSLQIAKTLADAGYTRVEIFTGGWPEWEKAGYPIAKGSGP